LTEPAAPQWSRNLLPAFIAGQVGVHAVMAGLRMAAPLQALREGYSPLAVGLLLALFAAGPVLMALQFGRWADRFGYHRPVLMAAGLSVLGMFCALGATMVGGSLHFALLCLAATLTGGGANLGNLTIQRSAGLAAPNATERVRWFSWLGVAPSFSNVLGPVLAGFLIDAYGFQAAYLGLLLLPLITLGALRMVPAGEGAANRAAASQAPPWDLLKTPGLKRLLAVNWIISTCWDVHTFVVPVLGHERGYNAATIGLILGCFTASVTAVRFIVPLLAHRLREVWTIRFSMLGTALVFALYPLAPNPALMMVCAALLGITLGVVQPMVLSTLHQITPERRHGQALAFRSMAINASSAVMPLVFGLGGVATGAAALFWAVGAAVGGGTWATRGLPRGR
jgi:MFS family permease